MSGSPIIQDGKLVGAVNDRPLFLAISFSCDMIRANEQFAIGIIELPIVWQSVFVMERLNLFQTD